MQQGRDRVITRKGGVGDAVPLLLVVEIVVAEHLFVSSPPTCILDDRIVPYLVVRPPHAHARAYRGCVGEEGG